MNFIRTQDRRIITGLVLVLVLGFALKVRAEEVQHQKYVDGFLQWIIHHSDEKTGLPLSHVGDDRFKNRISTYDASVVVLAFIAAGRLDPAKRIVDFYLETPAIWRLGGVIESINARPPSPGEDWSVRTGANLWFGMAAFHLYKKTNEVRYLNLSKKIAGLALGLQNREKGNDNFGGISIGPPGEPDIPTDQRFGYDPGKPSFKDVYPTEGNLDAYALFQMLFLETRDKCYEDAGKAVLSWLKLNAYNKTSHHFNRGFEDQAIATDVQSWGVSALGADTLEIFEAGAAEKIMGFVEENCVSEVPYQKPDGQRISITGADFIDRNQAKTLNREPLVSPEWTFQLINAYLRLRNDFDKRGEQEKARSSEKRRKELLESMLDMAIPVEVGLSYPYASEGDAVIGHEYFTPKPGNLSVIGVAYGILALKEYDPLNSESLFKKQ
ncbi:MAG: hypothetical protein KKF30_14910 [Proteobacteria bacterium]|nr:hypothetical protein [Pseudomonadota bacterium]MBU4470376.1 hypothetical protein [Pseudomonadota bacterium]MCG2753911.1 hypothetical protein [Desulfobacteraceae bacterium]